MSDNNIKILVYALMILWIAIVFLLNFKEILKDKYLHISITHGQIKIAETKHDVITLRDIFVISEKWDRVPIEIIKQAALKESDDRLLDKAKLLISTKIIEDYNRPPWEMFHERTLLIVNPLSK